MAKRPAYSFLLVKSDLIARADFGPSPEFESMGFWEQTQPANVRLYYSVEAAMRLGGKCGRTIWIIGEPFWTQTLSLPATALGGLNRDQIAKAIGFDVEALTGLSGTDSVLGFCKAAPSDESEHLWVTQVPLLSRTQIQAAVESAGSLLGGIVHPGGLPAPLDTGLETGESSTSWRRIEVWKDVTFCLMGHGPDAHRLAIINGDPAQDVWRTNVARWIASNNAEHSEWLGLHGSMADESLNQDAKAWTILPALTRTALQEWLGRWLLTLVNNVDAATVPIIDRGRADNVQRRQLTAIAAFTLVCIACCVLRYVWLANQRTTAIDQRNVLVRQQADRAQTLKDLEGFRDIVAVHQSPDFDLERQRVDKLLGALAEHAKPDLMIDRITLQPNGDLLIEGKCLPNAAVDSFVEELAAVLPVAGWNVSPAQKKPSGDIPSGEFSMRVAPLPLLRKKNSDGSDQIAPSLLAGGMK